MAEDAKYAFQCATCGALEPKEAAGDNELPHACHICGAGVEHAVEDGNIVKILHPENWIELNELDDSQLQENFHLHGLKRENVEKHVCEHPVIARDARWTLMTVSGPKREPMLVNVTARERLGTKDEATSETE